MEKTIKKVGDIEIKKQKIHQHKKTYLNKNIENNKVVVSNKVSVGKKEFKYLIDYKDAKKLCIYAYIFQK